MAGFEVTSMWALVSCPCDTTHCDDGPQYTRANAIVPSNSNHGNEYMTVELNIYVHQNNQYRVCTNKAHLSTAPILLPPIYRIFSRSCQNSLDTEILKEEKFVKHAMTPIMIMFTICMYNHILSNVYTCVVFDILQHPLWLEDIINSRISGWPLNWWYSFLFLPSVASTVMAASLFASLNGRQWNNS